MNDVVCSGPKGPHRGRRRRLGVDAAGFVYNSLANPRRNPNLFINTTGARRRRGIFVAAPFAAAAAAEPFNY